MLLLVSFVMIYYRKKPKYLQANTSESDNYHCTLKSSNNASHLTHQGPLWIDRYFEKEPKLLSLSATMPNVNKAEINSGSGEYAYISDNLLDNCEKSQNLAKNASNRHSLSTFLNMNGNSGPFSMTASMISAPPVTSVASIQPLQPLNTTIEPEPYATTDILRAEKEKLQHHYAVRLENYSLVISTVFCFGVPSCL